MSIQSKYAIFAIMALVLAAQTAYAATSSTLSGTPTAPSFNVSSGAIAVCRGQVDSIPIVITNLGYAPAVGYAQAAPNVSGPEMQQIVVGLGGKGLYSSPNGNSDNNVGPHHSITINVPTFVSANASSLMFAQVSITYNFLYLYTDSEVRNVTFVTERCPMPLSINATPSTLVSDQTENLTLNLTNNGNTTLTNLLIHISIPGSDGGVLENQPIQVTSVSPHNSVVLNESIDIYANASSSFPVNITTTFYNGSRLNQVLNNRFFLSTGLIQLTPSSITVSPSGASPGSIFSMSFVLTDTGTAGASGMTATALPTKGFKTFSSNSVFVGSISADGQTSVTISQEVLNSTKPGVYTVPVRVNYLNNLRQNMSAIVNVTVPVGAPFLASANGSGTIVRQSAGGGGIIELLMVIVIIVLAVLLYRERRRRAAK